MLSADAAVTVSASAAPMGLTHAMNAYTVTGYLKSGLGGNGLAERRRVNWAQLTRKWAFKFRNTKVRPMRIKTERPLRDLSMKNPVYNTLLRL